MENYYYYAKRVRRKLKPFSNIGNKFDLRINLENTDTKIIRNPDVSCMNLKGRQSSVGLDGLRVTCSPQDPRFTGINPAEVDGFFQDVKILSTSPQARGPESKISDSLKNLKPEKIGL